MAYDVHLHVSFACDKNEGVAALAAKHLPRLAQQGVALNVSYREAVWFLEDLAGRTGINRGPKGGLSLWGMVVNGAVVEDFVAVLGAFWTELLSGELDGGPLDFERVVVFEEQEQSEAATAYEIRVEDNALTIKKSGDLPFSWAQA